MPTKNNLREIKVFNAGEKVPENAQHLYTHWQGGAYVPQFFFLVENTPTEKVQLNHLSNTPSSEQWSLIEKEFNMLFTDSHPGDSGIGGNDPQDPVYEISTGDPKEILDFFRTHWHNREGELRGKIERMKYQPLDATDVAGLSFNMAITRVLAILDKKE